MEGNSWASRIATPFKRCLFVGFGVLCMPLEESVTLENRSSRSQGSKECSHLVCQSQGVLEGRVPTVPLPLLFFKETALSRSHYQSERRFFYSMYT